MCGPRERRLAGEHLVRDNGERIDIRARIEVSLTRHLLGRHVAERSDSNSRSGQSLGGGFYSRRLDRSRNSEVG
jgi:hypothetical protein